MRITSKSKIKEYALAVSAQERFKKFTRVGSSFTEAIEAATKSSIADRVRKHPSVGKTLL